MPSTLDTFRAQREAAEQVQARLVEVADLLGRLRAQVDLLASNKDLRALLQEEQTWLLRTERAVANVRAWREQEARRFWPGVIGRWVLALAFALASAASAGAGYAWVTRPYAAELAAMRSRVEFAEAISQRIVTMTPAERRQFDALMKWQRSSR